MPPLPRPAPVLERELEAALLAREPDILALDYGRLIRLPGESHPRARYTSLGRHCPTVATLPLGASRERLCSLLSDLPHVAPAAGFLAYELHHLLERAAPSQTIASPCPSELVRFVSLETAIITDHAQSAPESRTVEPLAPIAAQPPPRVSLAECAEFTRAAYADRVQAIQEDIFAGEYYELNFTQRFRLVSAAAPQHVAFILRRRLAPRYWSFLDLGEYAVISASPELFLRRRGHQLLTKPIKGSAPRGHTPVSDRAHINALRTNPKDSAEHTMVVDLARNDLGRVSRYGTVRVRSRAAIESLPAVHHLVSTITGQLRPGTTLPDILRATFPPASITGAPKIRVMQAIARHEISPRGIYCGAIGLVAPKGDFDFNVAIRTLVARSLANGVYAYTWGAGGAVVADSDPAGEWQECLLKAQPLLDAILAAETLF